MSEEETSSSSSSRSSSSSVDDQTKSSAPSSSSLPKVLELNKANDVEGNERMESGKDERKNNPSKNANTNNTSKKKRKRKQRSKSEDERELLELQKERYDRLIYTARKQLHKTAKQIKTFLLQKEIRKQSSKGGGNAGAKIGLDAKKSLDLDVVTSQAIRQLGLYHCDPRFKMATEETTAEDQPVDPEESKSEEKNPGKEENGSYSNNKKKKGAKKNTKKDDNTPPVIPTPLAPDDPRKPLVDAVLTHKRFLKSLEEWNEKVTDYRRWCMKLEQRNNPNPFGMDDDFVPSKRSKKKKSKTKPDHFSAGMSDAGLQATVENESSLFCTLGGGIPSASNGPDEFNKYSQYGPASDMADAPKRKNRKGQRQRRAKALAIEAKKQGRSHEYYQSANWREPKPKEGNDDGEKGQRKSRGRGRETNRNQRPKQPQSQNRDYSSSHETNQQKQHSSSSNNNQADEKQHPSWAAKQAQSTGIVAFKGTKITF